METETLQYSEVRVALSEGPSDTLEAHLRNALDADEDARRNYHIRSALQSRIAERTNERPS